MNNLKQVMAKDLKPGDVIDTGALETVRFVCLSEVHPNRCSVHTDMCGVACDVDAMYFVVDKGQQ